MTKGHWEMLSCTVGFMSCRLQSVNGLVLVIANNLLNGMNLLSCANIGNPDTLDEFGEKIFGLKKVLKLVPIST